MSEIRLNYTPKFSDAWMGYRLWERKLRKRWVRYFSAIWWVLAVVYLILIALDYREHLHWLNKHCEFNPTGFTLKEWASDTWQWLNNGFDGWLLLLTGLMLLIGTGLVNKFFLWLRMRLYKVFTLPREWIINDESMRYVMPAMGIESNLQWSFFKKWAEDKNTFALVSGISSAQFYYFPKSAFASEPAIDQFRNFLTAKIGPAI